MKESSVQRGEKRDRETVMAALEECPVFCALTLNIHETNQTAVCDKFYIRTLPFTHRVTRTRFNQPQKLSNSSGQG
jgi:hypothetical protein